MSIKNTNIADYLVQIEKLTSTNLQILKTINDSFFTKKNHLFAEIDDTTYVIPSFLSLENKINMLQENFENLVKAPENNEAYFNFDGNTRAIEVRKYSHVPDSLKLNTVSSYSVESNDVFKDFLTPVPYINFELLDLPNDIVDVNVKKVVAKSNALKQLFKNKLMHEETDTDGNIIIKYNQSINEDYANIYKILSNYIEDIDYIEYETLYKLPIRKNIGTSTYIIESVISDIINDDLEEIVTLKLRNDMKDSKFNNNLTYKLFDETIEKPLKVGDVLTNFDGTGKVIITELRPNTNTIVVKILNGEYLNFLGTEDYDNNNDTDIHDFSKLRFYADIDFNKDKVLKVPLEEDQYVFIAVAAVNSRMNVQSAWGTGVVLDTYSLSNNDVKFNTYYENNVKNIGDVLLEVSNMITSPINTLSQATFEALTSIKPVIKSDDLSVLQINKHLNESDTVKNIREAYKQKKTAEQQLKEINTKINEINDKLSTVSFNDVTGVRNIYTTNLTQYNNQKNELLSTINSAINNISLNVNNSEIPIENAKYRIRGFFTPDFDKIDNINLNDHIIGIQVQYRYKNINSYLGNAVTLNNSYIYSDWNVYNTRNKIKLAKCVDGIYSYEYEKNNETINEPSYNQIDIPISQGETVDIRIKVVYDFGQPYITMTSDWSEIVNIEFPAEFNVDIPVLTIIEENNNDISTNKFNNILETSGVNSHINDLIVDNNITYYHKPDNIASGFYTNERRIIPLKDKLISIDNEIASLKSNILWSNELYNVTVSIGELITDIYPDRDNTIILESYNNIGNSTSNISGSYIKENDIINVILNINISNTSNYPLKLFSLFPGNRDLTINNTNSTYFNKENYCNKDGGVYIAYKDGKYDKNTLQTNNQFITFRIKDIWTAEEYYTINRTADNYDTTQSLTELPDFNKNIDDDLIIYPYLSTKYGLCIDSNEIRSNLVISPNEMITVPLLCRYKITNADKDFVKTISFDMRTSLYSDPINYTFKVIAKKQNSILDNLHIENNSKQLVNNLLSKLTNIKKYNNTVK